MKPYPDMNKRKTYEPLSTIPEEDFEFPEVENNENDATNETNAQNENEDSDDLSVEPAITFCSDKNISRIVYTPVSPNEFEILKHKKRNGKIVYLLHKKNTSNNTDRWVQKEELPEPALLNEYESTTETKRNTPSFNFIRFSWVFLLLVQLFFSPGIFALTIRPYL